MSSEDEKSGARNTAISMAATDENSTRRVLDESEDEVSPDAIGTGNLPPGYFYSAHFIGTLLAVTLMNISLYVGYVLPVS